MSRTKTNPITGRIIRERRALNTFFSTLDAKIKAKDLPEDLKPNPEIVGNYVHSVVDCVSVYAISCKETSGDVVHLKIGFASNIKQRLGGIDNGCPLEISKVLYFCTGSQGAAMALEKAIHEELKPYHSKLEWFRFPSQAEYTKAFLALTEFVVDYMGDRFNMNVFDARQEFDEAAQTALVFVQALWNESVRSVGGKAKNGRLKDGI